MIAPSMDASLGVQKTPLNCNIVVAVCQCQAINDAPRLRGQVAAAFAGNLSASVLKQCDEQNLPALLALRQALDQAQMTIGQCADWGLVAVPRMLGRRRVADTIAKYKEQGAWSTSPHVIYSSSLHSASGLFSQALGLNGPNLGAGGMPNSEGEGLLAAITLLEGEKLPGVWLIFTAWERESLDLTDVRCRVAVLGLRSGTWVPHNHRLTFTSSEDPPTSPLFSFASLCDSIRLRRDERWKIGTLNCDLSCQAAHLEVAA